MREPMVNDCQDQSKTCYCGNKAIKEVLEPFDLLTGRMSVYYCSECFNEWKNKQKVNLDEVKQMFIKSGMDEAEAKKTINLIYKK